MNRKNYLITGGADNIGSEVEISVLELAQEIIKLAKSSSKIVHTQPPAEGDMTRRCPDNSKMKQLLGRELLPLNEGLLKMQEHYTRQCDVVLLF